MSVSSLLLVTVTSEVARIGRAKCIAMVGARDQFPIPLHYIIYDLASPPGPHIGGVTGEERKAEAKTEGLVNGVDPVRQHSGALLIDHNKHSCGS